jgi:hypothetical protein
MDRDSDNDHGGDSDRNDNDHGGDRDDDHGGDRNDDHDSDRTATRRDDEERPSQRARQATQRAVTATLGSAAVVEFDTVDVPDATARTRPVTADGEVVGVELTLSVGPVETECVLDPDAAAVLAADLETATDGPTADATDRGDEDEGSVGSDPVDSARPQ